MCEVVNIRASKAARGAGCRFLPWCTMPRRCEHLGHSARDVRGRYHKAHRMSCRRSLGFLLSFVLLVGLVCWGWCALPRWWG